MQKNLFVTLTSASFVSALLALVCYFTSHGDMVSLFIIISSVLSGFIAWQFACMTKCPAQVEVDELKREREFDAVWREFDAVHTKINTGCEKSETV